jgi:hypothetical protein
MGLWLINTSQCLPQQPHGFQAPCTGCVAYVILSYQQRQHECDVCQAGRLGIVSRQIIHGHETLLNLNTPMFEWFPNIVPARQLTIIVGCLMLHT